MLPSLLEVSRVRDPDSRVVRTWFEGFTAGRIGSPRRDRVWAWLDGDDLVLCIPDKPITEAL